MSREGYSLRTPPDLLIPNPSFINNDPVAFRRYVQSVNIELVRALKLVYGDLTELAEWSYAHLTLSSDQANITNNTATKIAWDTAVKDIQSEADVTTNNRVTVKKRGLYIYDAQVEVKNINNDTNIHLYIYINGSAKKEAKKETNVGGRTIGKSGTIFLEVGDYVEVFFKHVNGDNVPDIESDSTTTYFELSRFR